MFWAGRFSPGHFYVFRIFLARPRKREDGEVTTEALHEIALLEMTAPCPFVVKLLDVGVFSDSFHLVFEKAERTLAVAGCQDHTALMSVAQQLLSALSFLHKLSVVHNDLKPKNVLVLGDHVWLSDLGNSFVCKEWRPLPSEASVKKHGIHEITLGYRAPEVLLGLREYNSPVDMWSLGVTLVECFHHGPFLNQHTQYVTWYSFSFCKPLSVFFFASPIRNQTIDFSEKTPGQGRDHQAASISWL